MKRQVTVLRSLLSLFIFVLSSAIPSIAAENPLSTEASHVLDGRSYVGQNGSKGMPADHPDELIFANGQLISTSCDPYGFGPGTYKTEISGGNVTFEAITQSPTHGQISWRGVVIGDTMDATMIWTKERWYWDTRKEYWFKGKLKQ